MSTAYAGWALLELMGHRQRVGRVSEVEAYGGKLLRIDIPVGEGAEDITEFYGVTSVYALRPLAEDVARRQYDDRPVAPVGYRLPARGETGQGGASGLSCDPGGELDPGELDLEDTD